MNLLHLTEDEQDASWWMHSQEEQEEQEYLLDREQRTPFERACETTLPLFTRIWADGDYRVINPWLLGAGSFCSKEVHEEVVFLSNLSFIKEDIQTGA